MTQLSSTAMTAGQDGSKKKPKVMMVGHRPSTVDDTYWKHLESMVEFHFVPQASYEDSIPLFRSAAESHGPFSALIYMLEWGQPVPFPMDERLLAPLVADPKTGKYQGIRMASSAGAGYDRVDVEWLKRHGVVFANNPICVGKRTADSTMMMIMQALRGSSEQERHLRAGLWADRTLRARDASVCTVGIVGLGNIGRQVARHCVYLGFKRIQYYQRSRLGKEEERSYHYVSFDNLLATSDVIVLMTPLTPQTTHLIGSAEFEKMQDGVIIVNTSRGAVIDEAELVKALDSGKVLRAALDVFENEPKIHPGLINHPHTTLTPHVAVFGERLVYEAQREILENLEAFIKTGKPNTPVNE